jgi:DNA-binding NtrC family response regulator
VCDLAGLSGALMESELFGHVRGAFTGADREREGLFGEASGGTLFLDELGELPLDAQPRLLRALGAREYKAVGDTRFKKLDVRVVAATNRDLAEECKAGRFRTDLFHRLSTVRVQLPPLRHHKEDLPALVAAFLEGREIEVPPDTLALLNAYHWPGNVRELKNVVERALALVGDGRSLVPELLGLGGSSASLAEEDSFHAAKDRLVSTWERSYLVDLLQRAGGNVSRAAQRAGLSRPHLHALLKKHGIQDQK